MKRIVVILLALIMMMCCTSCMEDNSIDSHYDEVVKISTEIDNIKADIAKLEQENIELEKEIEALEAEDLGEKELEIRKECIDAENQKNRLNAVGLEVIPSDYIHYLINLYYNEKEFEDLYVDNVAYTYEEEGTTIYRYVYVFNKKDELIIFLETEIAEDGLHAERIKLYYDKDAGDIKEYKVFKKYAMMMTYAFVMMKEDSKVVNDDIKMKSEDFYKSKCYDEYFAQYGTMGMYETFTISGH
jgi:cell division protein FtsB